MKQVNRQFILAVDSHSPSELAHSRTEKSALYGGPPPSLLLPPPPAVGPGPWPHCPELGVKGLQEEDQSPSHQVSHFWPEGQVKARTPVRLVSSHHCPH